MKISPARLAAFDILFRIETEKAYSSVLLPQFEDRLSSPDAALCHELVLGTLRRQIWLDRAIDALAGNKKLDAVVRISLRMGLYQLKFLDRIPDHSAVAESVELVKRAKKTSAAGMVNAVLRRAAAEAIELGYADDTERISIETSHPRWLIEKWAASLGPDDAEQLARANNDVPRPAFRVTARGAALSIDPSWTQSEFVDNCFAAPGPNANLRDMAESGQIYFQDEASQLVANAVDVPDGGAFLDVCAAPGGKTGSIAQRLGGKTALLVAGDLHRSRVELLRHNLRRQGEDNVLTLRYDAAFALPFDDKSMDTVLVDAPCTGTGTIRHNPEVRYFLDVGDFATLAVKQLAILRNASKLVKQGGSLVYSTCSLEPEENEAVCLQFAKEAGDFAPVVPRVPERFITADGFGRTFPDRDQMDGFFVAEFGRK